MQEKMSLICRVLLGWKKGQDGVFWFGPTGEYIRRRDGNGLRVGEENLANEHCRGLIEKALYKAGIFHIAYSKAGVCTLQKEGASLSDIIVACSEVEFHALIDAADQFCKKEMKEVKKR